MPLVPLLPSAIADGRSVLSYGVLTAVRAVFIRVFVRVFVRFAETSRELRDAPDCRLSTIWEEN